MPNEFVNSIVIQIRHYRESRNLSQQEMAAALGVGHRTYQRIESGESIPTIDVLYKISVFLNLPIEHIVNPASHLSKDDAFKPYADLNEFLKSEGVRESKIVELSNHPSLLKSFEENNIDSLISIDEFYLSKYPFSVSDPKWTILNMAAQKKVKSKSYKVPTSTGHDSQERLGKIWALLVKGNFNYFRDRHRPTLGSGELVLNSECIFIKSKSNYFVLCYLK